MTTFFQTCRTSAHLLRPPHCRVPGVWACHIPRQAWCPLELCKPVLLFWRHLSPPPASAHTAHGLTTACLAVGPSSRIRRWAQACSPLRAPYPVCAQQEFRSDHWRAPSSPLTDISSTESRSFYSGGAEVCVSTFVFLGGITKCWQ